MAIKDDDKLQASRYADGEMDKAEQQQFETRLQSDTELQAYVNQYKNARSAVFAVPVLRLMQMHLPRYVIHRRRYLLPVKAISFLIR